MSVIEFHNVSKKFTRHAGQMLLRNHLTRFFTRQSNDPFFALKRVSFSVERGESLAVIGSNGAGKSTLMGLVAGISQPDEGTVTVNGQVAALLELGSGFHPDLTGRENVKLNAALLLKLTGISMFMLAAGLVVFRMLKPRFSDHL